MIEIRDEFGGTPQNFCTFDARKFSKFVLLMQAIFCEKFPQKFALKPPIFQIFGAFGAENL